MKNGLGVVFFRYLLEIFSLNTESNSSFPPKTTVADAQYTNVSEAFLQKRREGNVTVLISWF